jgi:hypothetical protein
MSDEQRIPNPNFSFQPAPETVAFMAAVLQSGLHGGGARDCVEDALTICAEVESRVRSGEIKV